MKKQTWIVVANNSQARFFTLDGETLSENECKVHPEGRLQQRELVSDRPGSTGPGAGSGKYPMGQKTSQKKNEMSQFAKQIAEKIELARKEGELESIYLVASPQLLGMIRENLSSSTQKIIKVQEDKDITHFKPKEIYAWYESQKF